MTWKMDTARVDALMGELASGGRFAGVVVAGGGLLGRSSAPTVLEVDDGQVVLHAQAPAEALHEPAAGLVVARGRRGAFHLAGRRLTGHTTTPHHGDESARELAARHRALAVVPRPADMPAGDYERLLRHASSQRVVWCELWLGVLVAAGAHLGRGPEGASNAR